MGLPDSIAAGRRAGGDGLRLGRGGLFRRRRRGDRRRDPGRLPDPVDGGRDRQGRCCLVRRDDPGHGGAGAALRSARRSIGRNRAGGPADPAGVLAGPGHGGAGQGPGRADDRHADRAGALGLGPARALGPRAGLDLGFDPVRRSGRPVARRGDRAQRRPGLGRRAAVRPGRRRSRRAGAPGTAPAGRAAAAVSVRRPAAGGPGRGVEGAGRAWPPVRPVLAAPELAGAGGHAGPADP